MNKKKSSDKKAFGLLSAVFLGIGSMVGAGIFIVIGEAGAIAGNLVTVSFLVGGVIALLCGYSLSRLAVYYPSRGGIIEYLVQAYGEGVISGAMGVLFYFAQLIALAAVAKSFGTYAATYMSGGVTPFYSNLFSVGILLLFVCINLIGATMVARAENIIVIIKLVALTVFTVAALLYIQPSNLVVENAPGVMNIFYALGLTFFAFQGFSVITNSVEDMDDPKATMLRAMFWAIGLVAVLYISVSIAVFGNLPLDMIIKDKDYALAEAAKPAFGVWGFKIMAATALLATASAINATLYAVTQISYTLAREGDLPEVYEYNVFHNTEGLVISALLIVPMMLFFNLGEIATVAAIAVLLIQGVTHSGHLLKYRETGANRWWVAAAAVGTFGAAGFAIAYTSRSLPNIVYYMAGVLLLAFLSEILLRLVNKRTVSQQVTSVIKNIENLI
ncbi:MAG TPA: amino acid permease [Gammaproteobacteria bacterium]|nr:amino acid permease [Gammaproteobacteria bacterium]